MAVPSNRVPVRVGRGLKSALTANLSDLLEGELVYAKDEDKLYIVEGGGLVPMGADLAASSIDELGDVDTSTAAPTDGQALVWNGVDSWVPETVTTSVSFNDLTDGTTTQYIGTLFQLTVYSGETTRTGYFNPNSDSAYAYSGIRTFANGGSSFVGGGGIGDRSSLVMLPGGYSYFAEDPSDGVSVPSNYTLRIKTTGVAGDDVSYGNPPTLGTGTNDLVIPTMGQVRSYADSVAVGSIDDLTDVDTTTAAPTDGQVLTWVDANSQWEPVDTSTAINDLTDVDTTTSTPTDGQVLTWVDANSQWEPADTAADAVDSVNGQTGVVSLGAGDLSDVSVVSPEANQYLTYDPGTAQFQNKLWTAIPGAPLSETSAGITGQIRFDPNFLYLCVSPNFWKKISLLSFGEGVATGVIADAGNFTAGTSLGEDAIYDGGNFTTGTTQDDQSTKLDGGDFTIGTTADAGNFTAGTSLGKDAIYDGGNFTTGTTQDDQSVKLDGGDFTSVLVDAGNFTVGTSSSEDVTYDGGNFTTGDSGSEDITLDGGSFTS